MGNEQVEKKGEYFETLKRIYKGGIKKESTTITIRLKNK